MSATIPSPPITNGKAADVHGIRVHSESLCSRLLGWPMRFVLALEVPEVRLRRECRGMFSWTFRQLFRAQLADRFAEDCSCAVLNAESILEQFADADLTDPENAEALEREFLLVALHETGHAATQRRELIPLSSADLCLAWEAYSRNATGGPPDKDDRQSPPWRGHEVPFLRAVCHLSCRARQLGYDLLPAQRVVDVQRYALSRMEIAYVPAIRAECERLAGLPLADVLALPAPAEFVSVFERDRAEWFMSLSNREQEK